MKKIDDILDGMYRDAESDRQACEIRMSQERSRIEHYAYIKRELQGFIDDAKEFDDMCCFDRIVFLKNMWVNTSWSDSDELRDMAVEILLDSIDEGSVSIVKCVYLQLSEFWGDQYGD